MAESKKQTAVRIIEKMLTYESHRWFRTTHLLILCDIPTTKRSVTLKILHALVEGDVLQSFGSQQLRWKLREDAANDWRVKVDAINWKEAAAAAPKVSDTAVNELRQEVRRLREQVEELAENQNSGPSVVEIVIPSKQVSVELTDVVLPSFYQTALDLANARRNIMLVGPAGCGKTFSAKLIAESLDMRFRSISCSAGMTETHLTGRAIPNITTGDTSFQTTDFLDMYENGGLFLFDELDAADPNLLLCVNSALANGYCNVPNRAYKPRAEMHKDFVCAASANTFGRGANRTYAGRATLDEATLSRFRIGMIECDYDENVERSLCPRDEIRLPLQAIRRKIQNAGLRRSLDTRFIEDAYIMHTTCGWTSTKIIETFFAGWPEDEKAKLAI